MEPVTEKAKRIYMIPVGIPLYDPTTGKSTRTRVYGSFSGIFINETVFSVLSLGSRKIV
jgi:hypothetical protein